MSEEAVRAAVEGRFNTQWAAYTPIAFENVGFTPPNGDTSWVRIMVQFAGASQIGYGDDSKRLMRQAGVISVSCFTPLNGGTAPGLALVGRVRTIFQNAQFSGVLCRATSGVSVGKDPELPFYLTAANTPFQYDYYYP